MRECYCHIPPRLLVQIVREKFINSIPTITLMKMHLGEQGHVETVALLDVPEVEIRKMFAKDLEFLAHFFDCRRHALQVLSGELPDLGRHLSGL